MKALKDYAQALVAVTNAADGAAYNAAVAQLAWAVGTIGKDASPQGAAATIFAPVAVTDGTALDQQRLDSLKAGIIAADTPISYLATVAGAGLFALELARQEALVEEVNILTRRLGPSMTGAAYQQTLSDAQGVVDVLDGLRKADPTAVAAGLVKAHEALVAAVNDPSRNYPSLVAAVGDFADQATALNIALTATPPRKSRTAK
jgi:hypothetical protein